jgi:galactose-3-O-sulfotransferase
MNSRFLDLFSLSRVPSTVPRLIYVHLPRTGGTALKRDILFPNFPRRWCEVNYSPDLMPLGGAQDLLSWPPARRNKVRVVAGHMPFGLGEQLEGSSDYITILRDPILRVVSGYHFCRNNPDNPAHLSARELPLAEFVRQGCGQSQNCYARWLSNRVFGTQFSSDEEMLAVAMQNLARFSFVGITERFDESVRRLCTKYGLVQHTTSTCNRNSHTPTDVCLSREEEIISAWNVLDLQIYRTYRQLFESASPRG